MRSLIFLSIVVSLMLKPQNAWASADSIGPNGINSSGLMLTGAGIDIGQVEVFRPGDPGVGKDQSTNLTNSTVDPEQVFFRQSNTNFVPNYNLVNETDDHAERVAGIMISTDAFAQGVAQEADLFSIGVNPTDDVSFETTYEETAVSTNHIATLPGQELWAINISALALPIAGENADGTSTLTSYVDWSARRHDILYVTGNPESGAPAGRVVLADNFNGLTVVFSKKNGSKYRQVGDENVFTADDFWIDNGNYTHPDILAPGTGILMTFRNDVEAIAGTGTSFAVPHVTGTVALGFNEK